MYIWYPYAHYKHCPYMSNIPEFDHNYVIPPFVDEPTVSKNVSPYPCSTVEVCKIFGTTKERVDILKRWLKFRAILDEVGIVNGFQWLDGSFLENIEVSQKRAPADLDLLMFYKDVTLETQQKVAQDYPTLFDQSVLKRDFKLDLYLLNYAANPENTVEFVRFWIQLFTHNRDGVWKGMLKIPLNTPKEDSEALTLLNGLDDES